MTLKFGLSLEYQRHTIDAALGVFDGQPIAQSGFVCKYELLPPDFTGERVVLIGRRRDWKNLMSVQSKEPPERKHGRNSD